MPTLRVPAVALVVALLSLVSPGLWATPDEGAAVIQAQLGDLLFREARFREATDAYERAWEQGEGSARERGGRGLARSLIRLGEFRRANEVAAALVTIAAQQPEALAMHGDTLWTVGLFEEAEARYRETLALSAGNPRAQSGLARALLSRNRLDDALSAAAAAVADAPDEGEYHHTLGFVYERLRRYPEAAASYANYVNLLPDRDRTDRAIWARQQVRFLRSFRDRQPLAIAGDAPGMVHTVPFQLVRDKVTVRARLNGGPPVEIVLDTGSELTVLSNRVAERFGVAPLVHTLSAGVGRGGLRGLQLGRLDSIQIGTLAIANVPVLIKNPPLRDLPTREAESFSPVAFGLSVSIDYVRRVLTIGRRLPPMPADVELPLRTFRLSTVRGVVNRESQVPFVVDTGGEVISISRATLDHLPVVPSFRRIPLRVYGASGWDPEAFLLPGMHLAFEAVQLANQPVVVLNLDAPSALLGYDLGGIVGHRFLSRYLVGLDLERSVLKLSAL